MMKLRQKLLYIDICILFFVSSLLLHRHYDVLRVCKTCCSLKVCANRSYYTHSPPRPFTQKHSLPSPFMLLLSFSSSLSFCVSVISSVFNLWNSGQECPAKLVKMTSNSRRRRQTGLTSLLTHCRMMKEWRRRENKGDDSSDGEKQKIRKIMYSAAQCHLHILLIKTGQKSLS